MLAVILASARAFVHFQDPALRLEPAYRPIRLHTEESGASRTPFSCYYALGDLLAGRTVVMPEQGQFDFPVWWWRYVGLVRLRIDPDPRLLVFVPEREARSSGHGEWRCDGISVYVQADLGPPQDLLYLLPVVSKQTFLLVGASGLRQLRQSP